MNTGNTQMVLDEITRFYLSSGDFNGIPVRDLATDLGLEWEDPVRDLGKLIAEDSE